MMEFLAAVALAAAFLIALELALRLMGLGEFPLFESAAQGRYRVRPHQSGRFRRRIRWSYDAQGMRTDRPPAGFAETTLLIGDSVVDGGLRIDQDGTVASVATRLSGDDFYPVACHGWALANCVPALQSLPGWAEAKRLVFVLNTGDLDTVVELGNELTLPTRHPLWLTLRLAHRQTYRYLLNQRHSRRTRNSTQVERDEALRAGNLEAFRELLAAYAGPVFLVRYPMRGEDVRAEPYFEQLASLDPRIRILELADAPGWSEDCYADHIHPSARGAEVLARHLCEGLR